VIHHQALGNWGNQCFGGSGLSARSEAFEACRYAIDTLKHNARSGKKNTGRMVPVVGLVLVPVKPS